MSDLANKRIITVATTGAWSTKSHNPNLPTQPGEIAEDIYASWKEGASVAHIHIRDKEDNDSLDLDIFRDVLDRLYGKHPDCDIVCNLTSAGGIGNSEDDRIAPVTVLKPEIASFDCGSLNWRHNGVFDNNPKLLMKLGKAMIEAGVKPEVEVFDIGMIWEAKWYRDHGYLQDPVHFQFCMGVPGGIPATVENVILMKNALNQAMPGSTWSAFGTGKGAMEVMYAESY